MKKFKPYYKLINFPILFIYMELVLHIAMGFSLKYIPIYLLFSICYGSVVTILANLFGNNKFVLLSKIWTLIISLIYGIEYFAKMILASFYPFSILKTAANNHLEEFIGVILQTLAKKCYMILIFLLPFILVMIFCKENKSTHSTRSENNLSKETSSGRVQRKRSARIKPLGVIIISLIMTVAFFFAGKAVVTLGYSSGDVTPAYLYNTDTYFDDQVEQLGLATFLKQDIVHIIKPIESSEEFIDQGEEEIEEKTTYAYNIINIDLDSVASSTTNSNIKWLAKYFDSVSPTKKNAYTGTMSGYNVIFLTLEGLSGYAISEEYTPTLYKLSHEGFVFNNFYTALHFTSTSNGECQNLLGLYPKNGTPITMSRTGVLNTNCYFSLAQQLNRLGYRSLGFHNNQYNLYNRESSHKNLGYEYYGGHMSSGKFLIDSTNKWPQQDAYMIDVTTPMYVNDDTPFNVYYITISGHTPYNWSHANSEFKEALSNSGYSDTTNAYIATCMQVDKAMEHLLTALEEAGKLDNTLIVAVPDHIPYGSVEILEEITGQEFGTSEALTAINESAINFDVYKSMLIMWSGSMTEPVEIDKVCCQVDILPTISNLLGLEYDSRMLAGTDILSNSEGLVVFSSRSWKTDKGFYNRFTQEFTLADGVIMTDAAKESYVKTMKAKVENKLAMTEKIVESDFYDYALSTDKFRYDPEEKDLTAEFDILNNLWLRKLPRL